MLTANNLSFIRREITALEHRLHCETGTHITLAIASVAAEGTMDSMLAVIAANLNLPVSAYTSKSRIREYVELRFIAAHFIAQYFPSLSLSQVARLFGKDHSSVLHMRSTAQSLLDIKDPDFMPKYRRCKAALEIWHKTFKIPNENEQN